MADNVWTSLVQGILAFGRTRAADAVAGSFADTGNFVEALFDAFGDGEVVTQEVKDRFEELKEGIKDNKDWVKPIVDRLKPQFAEAKAGVLAAKTELETSPFTMEAAARAAIELSRFIEAIDRALDILAEELSKNEHGTIDPVLRDEIAGIGAPFRWPFEQLDALGGAASNAFDAFCEQVLGIDDATESLAERAKFDKAKRRLEFELDSHDRTTLPGGLISFESTTLTAFLDFKEDAVVGIAFETKLDAGIRSDPMLEKVLPGSANPTAESTMIQLDSKDGLTFGDGRNRVLTLPVSMSLPGVELREFKIGLPNDEDDEGADDRIEIYTTIAAKFGSAVGLMIEGAGVELTWNDAGDSPLEVSPRTPTGIGVSVDAGIVGGGGYIRRADTEYSGILDLKVAGFQLTAIGLMNTDPFSFVVIMSVRFSPQIQLGMGFTLDGLGGILAVDRTVSTDALRQGIQDGTANTLLFPDDPLAAAFTIIDKVRTIFPAEEGSFAVGPIAEIGWGSEAALLSAKIGVVLRLPDPVLILLGAVRIAVPSTKVDPQFTIVDLNAEVYGEFTPEYLLFMIGLSNSQVVGFSISGDVGLYIRWAGGADFAISVGGFFPDFDAPAPLQGMRRISVDLSPNKMVSLRASGYFALTTNSVQFGARIDMEARVGPARGEGWIGMDALFKWAPRFYFEIRLDLGISISVWGVDFFRVSFTGTLKGTTPWSIEGTASVGILWWDFDFDLGPYVWGARDTSQLPTVSPTGLIAEALREDSAWTMLLPTGTDQLARLIEDDTTPLLVHPLGSLEVKQMKVPLETRIDRVGTSRAAEPRVHLDNPRVQNAAADLVSHSEDRFAPGQFIELSDKEQINRPAYETFPAGMTVGAADGASFGPSSSVAVEWETVFPRDPSLDRIRSALLLGARDIRLAMRTSHVAMAAAQHLNPYMQAEAPDDPIDLADAGLREVRTRDDLAAVAGLEGVRTYTHAVEAIADLGGAIGADGRDGPYAAAGHVLVTPGAGS